MKTIEEIIKLPQARADLNSRVAEYKETIDDYPEDFSSPEERLSHLHQALCNIFGDHVSGLDFIDRQFSELGSYQTPRLATLKSREGFKAALGCLTI